jgi:hypothetical protein
VLCHFIMRYKATFLRGAEKINLRKGVATLSQNTNRVLRTVLKNAQNVNPLEKLVRARVLPKNASTPTVFHWAKQKRCERNEKSEALYEYRVELGTFATSCACRPWAFVTMGCLCPEAETYRCHLQRETVMLPLVVAALGVVGLLGKPPIVVQSTWVVVLRTHHLRH